MSGAPCPHCGRPLSQAVELVDLSSPDGSVDLDRALPDHSFGDRPASYDRLDESVLRRGPLLNLTFLATFVTFIVVVFGVGAAIGSGNPDADDQARVPDSAENLDQDEAVNGQASSSGSDTTPDFSGGGGDPDFPPSDDHLTGDVIAATFREQINVDGGYTVYYTTDSGIQSVSAAGVSDPQINVANTLHQLVGFPLISDGNRTWAVDAENPGTVFLVSTQFVVVDADLSGTVAFVDPRGDKTEVGVSSYGGWRPGIKIPDNSDILPVSGRGLLIAPPTGGTFLFSGTGRLQQLSDDRVVAAGVASEVFRRCDDELQCELYARMSDADGQRTDREYPLDVAIEAPITISPLGRFVATMSEVAGPVMLVETQTGDKRIIGEQAVVASGWAPDSSFLALATADELLIVSTATGDIVTMPLPSTPSASNLLVSRR